MSRDGLLKAYSSKLSLTQREGTLVVHKEISDEEAWNELFFFDALKRAGVSSLQACRTPDGIDVEFLDHAQTLADHATLSSYERFGAAMRDMHAIRFERPFRITERNKQKTTDWNTCIDEQIAYGTERQRVRHGLDDATVKRICTRLMHSPIRTFREPASLLHCDAHGNNVLLQDDTLYFIDKGSAIAAGDPLYDMALLGITLPGALYTASPSEQERALLYACMEGYGENFVENRQLFDDYVLLRILERYPSPFTHHIPDVVESILG